jgi:KTSC domain
MQVQIPGKRKIMGTPITSLNFFTPQQYSFSNFDSSNIQSFFYVPMTNMLTVLFVSGAVYEYFGVPWHVVQAWDGAGSKGTITRELLKPCPIKLSFDQLALDRSCKPFPTYE